MGKFWVSENYSFHKPPSGCIDIWYETTLGQGDASVCKLSSQGYIPRPKGT